MTPQSLCDALDAMQVTTRAAAEEIGCHETTLQMYCNGQRYPSHGGDKIEKVPRYIERAVIAMAVERGILLP